jgi:glycosyltransferase involved in cell wall biosynthesis
MSELPLVWVVTPVYNGERYLAEAIESVRAQTYRNWKYLIVDNCSTDETPEIARSYAEQDDRIRVHRNDRFLSMLANQNNALRQIPGDAAYCKMLHADDVLFPECLERMVELAVAHPSIGLVSSYRRFGTQIHGEGEVPAGVEVMPGRDVCRAALVENVYVFGSPSTILLRADLVRERDPFYDEDYLQADAAACFDVLLSSDFGFVHQVLTYTRLHEHATTSTADRLNTYSSGWLIILTRYGRAHLRPDEYAWSLVWGPWGLGRYLIFLLKASAKLRFLESEFRRHHTEALAVIRRNVRARELRRGFLLGISPARRGRTSFAARHHRTAGS